MHLNDIKELIYKYYPVNITNFYSPEYKESEAHLRFSPLLKEKNEKDHRPYIEKLKRKLNLEGRISTNHFSPSIGGIFTVERIEWEDYILIRELYFYISVLEPYYTIFGMSNFLEKNALFKLDKEGAPRSIMYPSLIIPFPEGQFTVPFNTLEAEIKEEHTDYQFMDWKFSQYRVPGLSIPYVADIQTTTVHHALFSSATFDRCRPVINHKRTPWLK